MGSAVLLWLRHNWFPVAAALALAGSVWWLSSRLNELSDLRRENQDLIQNVETLTLTIEEHSKAIKGYEDEQTSIRNAIRNVRKDLNSDTVLKEAQDDPVKASDNVSVRYRALDSMFDDATRTLVEARPTGPDADTN